jgi:putative copper export protein/methionine-rich copper-binding protein CopC
MLAGLIATLAVIVTPAILYAHARLVRSSPAVDGRVTTPPAAVSLWFSERPELRFTTIRLLDSAGVAVSVGAIAAVSGDSMGVEVPVTGAMTPGRYSVVWRTAAADGHATSGKFFFVVTAAAATPSSPASTSPGAAAAASPGGQAPSARVIPNSVVTPSYYAGFSPEFRWAEYVALITLIGVVVFRLFILREAALPADVTADAADRARRLANAVLLLFAISTVWRLAAQSDLIPTAGSARFDAMLSVVRDTHWGHGWLAGGVGVVVTALGLLIASESLVGWIVAGVGVVAICIGEAMTGHAAASRHVAFAISVDVAHVLSAGGWFGGLAAVAMCGLPATRKQAGAAPRATGHQLVRAYHNAAVQCVTLVIVTALCASWLRLTAFSDLWTTAYGSMLFRKIVFVIIALGFGLYHWRRVVRPQWDDDTRFRFQRSASGELVIGAVILAFTALLVATALPSA